LRRRCPVRAVQRLVAGPFSASGPTLSRPDQRCDKALHASSQLQHLAMPRSRRAAALPAGPEQAQGSCVTRELAAPRASPHNDCRDPATGLERLGRLHLCVTALLPLLSCLRRSRERASRRRWLTTQGSRVRAGGTGCAASRRASEAPAPAAHSHLPPAQMANQHRPRARISIAQEAVMPERLICLIE
jgi:hypothetical protein